MQVSLWPCIAKVVPLSTVGTANGIAAFLQGLNIGLTNLGIGKIMGAVEEWVFICESDYQKKSKTPNAIFYFNHTDKNCCKHNILPFVR